MHTQHIFVLSLKVLRLMFIHSDNKYFLGTLSLLATLSHAVRCYKKGKSPSLMSLAVTDDLVQWDFEGQVRSMKQIMRVFRWEGGILLLIRAENNSDRQ